MFEGCHLEGHVEVGHEGRTARHCVYHSRRHVPVQPGDRSGQVKPGQVRSVISRVEGAADSLGVAGEEAHSLDAGHRRGRREQICEPLLRNHVPTNSKRERRGKEAG